MQVKTQLVIAFAHALTKDSEFDQYEKEILTETIAKEEFDQVSLVASKDVHQSETELRVRAYMETIHKHFEVGMADNTKRLSLAFAIWRGLAKMSSKRIHNFTSETNPKKAIELGIKTIEKSWEIFSAGMSVVHFNEVSPIQEFLGEVCLPLLPSAPYIHTHIHTYIHTYIHIGCLMLHRWVRASLLLRLIPSCAPS